MASGAPAAAPDSKGRTTTADASAPPGRMHDGTHYILTGPRESQQLVVCVPGICGLNIYFSELEPVR